jgi:hypothetical protein
MPSLSSRERVGCDGVRQVYLRNGDVSHVWVLITTHGRVFPLRFCTTGFHDGQTFDGQYHFEVDVHFAS